MEPFAFMATRTVEDNMKIQIDDQIQDATKEHIDFIKSIQEQSKKLVEELAAKENAALLAKDKLIKLGLTEDEVKSLLS